MANGDGDGLWIWIRWGIVLVWVSLCELRIFRVWKTVKETGNVVILLSKESSTSWITLREDVAALKAAVERLATAAQIVRGVES